jgi:hypothetical protein
MPNLGRRFQEVMILDTHPDYQFYDLLVDFDSGEVIDDVEAMWAAEDQARFARYGKLDPALYERLQEIQESDFVSVTMWVVSAPGQSLDERQMAAFAILAARYPEADEAIRNGGKPMDVDDPELAQQIYNEYLQLVDFGVDVQVGPLVEALVIYVGKLYTDWD